MNSRFPKGFKLFIIFTGATVIWFILFVIGASILDGVFDNPVVPQVFWGIIAFAGLAFGSGFAAENVGDNHW